jgi:hypothetical protein
VHHIAVENAKCGDLTSEMTSHNDYADFIDSCYRSVKRPGIYKFCGAKIEILNGNVTNFGEGTIHRCIGEGRERQY